MDILMRNKIVLAEI